MQLKMFTWLHWSRDPGEILSIDRKYIFSTLACLHIGYPAPLHSLLPFSSLFSLYLPPREARVQLKQAETVTFPVGVVVVVVCHRKKEGKSYF